MTTSMKKMTKLTICFLALPSKFRLRGLYCNEVIQQDRTGQGRLDRWEGVEEERVDDDVVRV